jgi:probable rRNA maturation factor
MSDIFSIIDDTNGYKLNIDMDIQEKAWLANLSDLKVLVIRVSNSFVSYIKLNKYADTIEFSLIFMNNAGIEKLNLQYRAKDKPTNTLSFPAQELNIKEIDKIKFPDRFLILGDLVFSYAIIEDEAKEQNKSFVDHFTHLLIHGLLHLIGFDHEENDEAEEMERIEVAILATLGIESPYN